MCRFVAYLGHHVLLANVLVKPKNSIIMQALHASETDVPTNGDGFGVGWYVPHLGNDPGLFTSISPAWNDRNLLHLTNKIESPCFFAHVRAASEGGVTNYNCHPFIHKNWMFMHNGGIQDFIQVKRHLRHLLDDDIYHWIQGETDSEHLFALLMQNAKGHDLSRIETVGDIIAMTLKQIGQLVEKFGIPGPSLFNISLTDGKRLIACRYSNNDSEPAPSLHYITEKHMKKDARRVWFKYKPTERFVIVTSEKLGDFNTDWQDVPINHLMLVDEHHKVSFKTL